VDDGVEAALGAVVSQFCAREVVGCRPFALCDCQDLIRRGIEELGIRIDEALD
jgi:hypothetical protein